MQKKKLSCRLISREKMLARKYLGKVIFSSDKNIAHGV